MSKSRKELFANWPKERIDAFLKAESDGYIQEVPGGWMIEGAFCEKMPMKGEVLTSYLEYLANKKEITEKIDSEHPVCRCGHPASEHADGSVVGLGIACVAGIPAGTNDKGEELVTRCQCDDYGVEGSLAHREEQYYARMAAKSSE